MATFRKSTTIWYFYSSFDPEDSPRDICATEDAAWFQFMGQPMISSSFWWARPSQTWQITEVRCTYHSIHSIHCSCPVFWSCCPWPKGTTNCRCFSHFSDPFWTAIQSMGHKCSQQRGCMKFNLHLLWLDNQRRCLQASACSPHFNSVEFQAQPPTFFK